MDLNDDLTHGMTNKVIKVHFMFENSFVSFIFENGDIYLVKSHQILLKFDE